MIEPEVYRELVGTSIRGSYHRYAHKKLEKSLPVRNFNSVLEVGSGEGEHLEFVVHHFNEYFMTDIQKPKSFLKIDNPKIVFDVADVEGLKYENQVFDRVIVTCLLHHLTNPLGSLNEIKRVTANTGVISVLLPCDPGITFRMLRKITSDRFLKKQGITNVGFLRAMEHRNHYLSLIQMIQEVFKDDVMNIKTYPVKGLSWHLSLFSIIQIQVNHQD